jgi:hypothetical protein
MAERHPETDLGAQGAPWINGGSLRVSQLRITPTGPSEPSEESADADRESIETSREPLAELNNLATESSHSPDEASESLSETDWETTRYLAVATQLIRQL